MLLEVNLTKIAGLIARAVDTVLGSSNDFLRYQCILTSSCNVGGISEVSNKLIEFQVGKVDTSGGIVLKDREHASVRCEVVMTEELQKEVQSYANRENALSGHFGVFDHAGTIALLARAVAKYRFEGKLTVEDLLGGAEYSYEALRAQTRQVAASGYATVLPAGADEFGRPSVSAAIVAAVSGLGGTVYSHIVGVNADTNRARVPEASDEALALGCYDALNILAKQYDACGAGELFAWAHTIGMVQGGTVVGGTDEGGIVRDILRSVRFNIPYGPICINIQTPCPLPDPRVANGFVKYVDSILLQCAGAVAICDPLVMLDGQMYPTTLTSGYEATAKEKEVEADRLANDPTADTNVGTDGDALSLMKKLQTSFPSFLTLYSKALGRIYGLQGGGSKVVMSGSSALMSNLGKVKRHLKYKVVNPYFWIEPTGSTRFEAGDFPATIEGYGRLADVDNDGDVPAFRGVEEVADNGFSAAYKIHWRSARRHGMLQHLTAHKDDGLANFKMRQVNSHKVTGLGVGAAGRERETLGDKLANSRGLEEYLWRRGTSSVIGPAEILTPGARVGMVVNYRSVDVADGLKIDSLHAPTPSEMKQSVGFSVTGLQCVGVKKGGPGPTVKAMRQRDVAARALDRARLNESRLVDIDLLMPVSTQDEDFDDDLPGSDEGGARSVIVRTEPAPPEGAGETVGQEIKPSAMHGASVGPRTGNTGATKTERAMTNPVGSPTSAGLAPVGT